MTPEAVGVIMKRKSRCAKEARKQASDGLRHKIEECVSFIDSCEGLQSTPEGKWLIIYAEQARQLIIDPEAGLDKMNIALKQLEDHFFMCGNKLYPHNDSEPLRANKEQRCFIDNGQGGVL
jgi:undecaprenyl pyrophosphate synthase